VKDEHVFMVVFYIFIFLIAPGGWLYGWFFYFTRMRNESPSWRNRATLISLSLVTLAIVLWPVLLALEPEHRTVESLDHLYEWVNIWTKYVLRTLLVALVVGLFGRPRLILPISLACIGTGLFWIVATAP
jgi:hypothetical protein